MCRCLQRFLLIQAPPFASLQRFEPGLQSSVACSPMMLTRKKKKETLAASTHPSLSSSAFLLVASSPSHHRSSSVSLVLTLSFLHTNTRVSTLLIVHCPLSDSLFEPASVSIALSVDEGTQKQTRPLGQCPMHRAYPPISPPFLSSVLPCPPSA
jgi:hypothetical protein